MSTNILERSLLKGIALFGGTQMLNVLMGIVRGKMVATLLGTVGMGISSIYMSTLLPLQQFFALGIPTAIVSIVAALSTVDAEGQRSVAERIEACRRVLLILSVAGMLFVGGSAVWLSEAGFGDASHTRSYLLLAAALFFMIMESGETAFLQSRRMMKAVATRGVINAVAGLVVSVPLFWWLGVEGIVPSIIAVAFVVWLYPRWKTHRSGLGCRSLTWSATWSLGKGAIALGFFLMLTTLLGQVTTYLINICIRSMGSMGDVGLYQAANSITGQCATLVFAAMATDYYPRLSALKDSLAEAVTLVRKEYELVLLIMAPIVVALIVAAPLVIRILLTEEFLPLTGVLRLVALSLFCRAAYFPVGYISLAKGRKGFFFWVEGVWDNAKNLLLIIVFYHAWGFAGLGWAVLAGSIIDIAVTSPVVQHVFGITVGRATYTLFLPLFAGAALCAAFAFVADPLIAWTGMGVTAAAVTIAALYLLCGKARKEE